MEQRSSEWFEVRRGVFTASSISDLMKPKGFGKTGEDYIKLKVAESFGAYEEEIFSKPTEWGKELEPFAKEYYEKAIGLKISDIGFIKRGDYFGCSPDGIIGEKIGVEVKCPYNPKNHIDHLLIRSEQDLKGTNDKFYWQVQFSLWVTGFEKWIFISYDPRFQKNKMVAVDIRPIEKDQILIAERMEQAIDLFKKIKEKCES